MRSSQLPVAVWLSLLFWGSMDARFPAEPPICCTPGRPTRWLVPVFGALVLAGYDLAYDAFGSAVSGLWAYRDSGGLLGVPLSNLIGWIVTGWIILTTFARIERRLPLGRTAMSGSAGYCLLRCIVWGGMVLQYPLLQLSAPTGELVVGGRQFVTAGIYAAAARAGDQARDGSRLL